MLDTISFVANGDSTFTRTVTHVDIITDVVGELASLQAQIVDFNESIPMTDEINTAIINYQAAITVLSGK